MFSFAHTHYPHCSAYGVPLCCSLQGPVFPAKIEVPRSHGLACLPTMREGLCEMTCSAYVWTDVLKMWFALQIGGLWICWSFAQWLCCWMWTVGPLGWDRRHKHFQAPSVHNLFSLKIQKMVMLGQNCLLLKRGLQEISPQGTVLAEGFLSLFTLSFSLLSLICFFLHVLWDYVIFTIVLSLYCNYLSSHVQNSIPQLPCSLIFSLKPTHFSTFPLYFPCSYKFPSFSG